MCGSEYTRLSELETDQNQKTKPSFSGTRRVTANRGRKGTKKIQLKLYYCARNNNKMRSTGCRNKVQILTLDKVKHADDGCQACAKQTERKCQRTETFFMC
jgi:hypothetical protein